MGRHNREGRGTDQHEQRYRISFQPDWLRFVKVTRTLESGRQSTKTLFRNPASTRVTPPGDRVRTRLVSPAQDLDFEIAVTDPNQAIKRIRVTCMVTDEAEGTDREVEFTLEAALPPARR